MRPWAIACIGLALTTMTACGVDSPPTHPADPAPFSPNPK